MGSGARALVFVSWARSYTERGGCRPGPMAALAALRAMERPLDHSQNSWLLVLALPLCAVTLVGLCSFLDLSVPIQKGWYCFRPHHLCKSDRGLPMPVRSSDWLMVTS